MSYPLKMIKYGKIKKIVEEILKEDERARKDNSWLLYRVWQNYTKIFIPFEDFKKLPSPESIMRSKRLIQNKENKYHEIEIQEGITFEKPLEIKK